MAHKAIFYCIDPRYTDPKSNYFQSIASYRDGSYYHFTFPGGSLAILFDDFRDAFINSLKLLNDWDVPEITIISHLTCKAAKMLATKRNLPYSAQTERKLINEATDETQKILERYPNIRATFVLHSANGLPTKH